MLQQKKVYGLLAAFEESQDVLRHQGYRLTPQRALILQVLEEVNDHLSVEQMFERVKQRYPGFTLSTVYRTLDLLRELKLVRVTNFPGEPPKYEAFGGKTHHHLVCRKCKAILHIDHPLQEQLRTAMLQQHQFHHITVDIMTTGYCDECWHGVVKQQEEDV